MRVTSARFIALGLLLLGSAHAHAQEREAPRDRAPAPIMSFRGADWLERPERAAEEMPERVVGTLGLRPGDVVADMGAGSGYFTRRMAPLVAPGGIVYAVDVQREMLDILMESVEAEGLTGVEPVLGEAADPRLPRGVVDWILMVDVYHEFADPEPMLARMRESLSPTGRVALLEYRAEDGSGDHIRADHRMSVRQVLAEWEAAGFELDELHEFLPSQHFFVLRAARSERAGAGSRPLAHHDLLEGMRAGVVEVAATGTGGDTVTLSIRRTRPEPMVVTLPAGAYFDAAGAAGAAADMIARRDGMIVLREDGARAWRIEARRAQREAQPPGAGSLLVASAPEEHAPLRDVMWLFQNADVYPAVAPTVEQLAVWIVTEDAGWEDLAAHARSTSVHAANAVALAVAYVNGAGVDVRRKRIWGDRDQFVPAITDQGLRRAFEALEAN
jgi:predicted methyltransferase